MRLSYPLLLCGLLVGCCTTAVVSGQSPLPPSKAAPQEPRADGLPDFLRLLASEEPVSSQALLPINGSTFYLEEEITEGSVTAAIATLHKLEGEKKLDITLVIDSPGGLVAQGYKLSKAIERSPAKVTCVVDGTAASMAFFILQSCDVRMMTRRSILMMHEPSFGAQGRPGDIEDAWQELRALALAMASHSAERMGMSLEEFQKKTERRAWWMASDEALKARAVDRIISSPNVR